jgi:glutathione S-transferase
MSDLTVFTFSPAFGLPTAGPFALKLLKWLEIAGIPFRQVHEDDSRKGPKKKNPWIELDGERIGDSEIIIDLLAAKYAFDIDVGLTAERRAELHAARRMLEEHFHMIFEWEMFVHPNGTSFAREVAQTMVSPLVAGPMAAMVCRVMKKQLYARGIARHSDEIVAKKGKADVAAVEVLLGERAFLGGDHPSMADVSAYGLIQPMARWPMRTPVADYIKSRPALIAYLDRMEKLKAEQRLAA